jgi:hypothetical protein
MAEDAKTPQPRLSVVERPATSATASNIPSIAPIVPPDDSRSRPDGPPQIPVSEHILTWWFGLMALGGVGFGLVAERRPFGNGVLASPLVVFFACVAVALLTMRFLYAKPVPQVISERYLAVGCVIGIACFLVGNWFGVNLDSMP